jgi:hypothetical protein
VKCGERCEQQGGEELTTKRLETEKWAARLHVFVSHLFVVEVMAVEHGFHG